MTKLKLPQAHTLEQAIIDVQFIVSDQLQISQAEIMAKALSMYIGLQKPFANSENNAILQRHLLDQIKEENNAYL